MVAFIQINYGNLALTQAPLKLTQKQFQLGSGFHTAQTQHDDITQAVFFLTTILGNDRIPLEMLMEVVPQSPDFPPILLINLVGMADHEHDITRHKLTLPDSRSHEGYHQARFARTDRHDQNVIQELLGKPPAPDRPQMSNQTVKSADLVGSQGQILPKTDVMVDEMRV